MDESDKIFTELKNFFKLKPNEDVVFIETDSTRKRLKISLLFNEGTEELAYHRCRANCNFFVERTEYKKNLMNEDMPKDYIKILDFIFKTYI